MENEQHDNINDHNITREINEKKRLEERQAFISRMNIENILKKRAGNYWAHGGWFENSEPIKQ